jgi:hypothetical protein
MNDNAQYHHLRLNNIVTFLFSHVSLGANQDDD